MPIPDSAASVKRASPRRHRGPAVRFALHSLFCSQVERSQYGFFSRRIRVAFRRVSMTALCLRGLAALRPLCWLAMALFLAASASAVRADEQIVVHLDEARVIMFNDPATTEII